MRAVVHIGTHKTGTTSLQRWADANRSELFAATGLRYYRGRFARNHFEFATLAMRPDRNMPFRAKRFDWMLPTFQHDLRDHIARELDGDDDVLISAEALSLLRHPDEVDRLCELLEPRTTEFIVTLRDPAAYLASYRREMTGQSFAPSPHPDSFAYTEDDSWLVDFDALRALYDGLKVVPYEQALARWGSIIPAVMEAAGADPAELPSWEGMWANDRPKTRGRWLARKVKHRLRHPMG
jgi:hypothetical protein